jgi:hypothetical protein
MRKSSVVVVVSRARSQFTTCARINYASLSASQSLVSRVSAAKSAMMQNRERRLSTRNLGYVLSAVNPTVLTRDVRSATCGYMPYVLIAYAKRRAQGRPKELSAARHAI